MDNRERHIRENESQNQTANELRANAKNRKNSNILKNNRLWLWLGVIILIFILFWWIFGIGTAEDIVGTSNG